MATNTRRRFVLHFDVNNTVLMQDLAKGLTVNDNVSASQHAC